MSYSYTKERPYLTADREREWKDVAPGCRKTDLQTNNNNLHKTHTSQNITMAK
jgi:hypothetical protein